MTVYQEETEGIPKTLLPEATSRKEQEETEGRLLNYYPTNQS